MKLKILPFPIKSLLLAPLASILVNIGFALSDIDKYEFSKLLSGFLVLSMMTVPCSYLGVLLIGLPLFFLLRNLKWHLLLAACISGVALPTAIFSPYAEDLVVITGLAVGITAYFLRPTTPKANTLPSDDEVR